MVCNSLKITKQSAEYLSHSYTHCLVSEDDFLRWPEPEESYSGAIWDFYLKLSCESSKQVVCRNCFCDGDVFSIGGEMSSYAAWYEVSLGSGDEQLVVFVKSIFGSKDELMPSYTLLTEQLEYVESIDTRGWAGKNVVITQPFECGKQDYSSRIATIGKVSSGDIYIYKTHEPIERSVFVIILFNSNDNLLGGARRVFDASKEYEWFNAFGDL